MGIAKAWKLGVRSKLFLFSKTVQDYGNWSADIRLVMQAGGAISLYVMPTISIIVTNWERHIHQGGAKSNLSRKVIGSNPGAGKGFFLRFHSSTIETVAREKI